MLMVTYSANEKLYINADGLGFRLNYNWQNLHPGGVGRGEASRALGFRC